MRHPVSVKIVKDHPFGTEKKMGTHFRCDKQLDSTRLEKTLDNTLVLLSESLVVDRNTVFEILGQRAVGDML